MRPAVLLGSVATILVFGVVALQTQLDNVSTSTNGESLALVRETLTGVTVGSGSTLILATGLVFVAILFAVAARAAT
jgi:hypothetical protein